MLRRQFTKLLSATPLLGAFGFNSKEPDGSRENPYISEHKDWTKFYIDEDESYMIPLYQSFGNSFEKNAMLAEETVEMLVKSYKKIAYHKIIMLLLL